MRDRNEMDMMSCPQERPFFQALIISECMLIQALTYTHAPNNTHINVQTHTSALRLTKGDMFIDLEVILSKNNYKGLKN